MQIFQIITNIYIPNLNRTNLYYVLYYPLVLPLDFTIENIIFSFSSANSWHAINSKTIINILSAIKWNFPTQSWLISSQKQVPNASIRCLGLIMSSKYRLIPTYKRASQNSDPRAYYFGRAPRVVDPTPSDAWNFFILQIPLPHCFRVRGEVLVITWLWV